MANPEAVETAWDRPDEDRLELPAEWRKHLPLRRDRPRKVEADLARAERTREVLAENVESIVAILEQEQNEGIREVALAFADGAPEPFGAAVIATIVQYTDLSGVVRPFDFFNLVLADHGPVVTVEAAMDLLAIRPVLFEDSDRMEFHWGEMEELGWFWEQFTGVIDAVRELVVAVPDEQYEAIVSAVDRIRDSPERRLAAALLVADEAEWVEVACAESSGRGGDFITDRLLRVLHTVDQVEMVLGMYWGGMTTVERITPLVWTAGAAALPYLTEPLQWHRRAAERRLLLKSIAILPGDDAMAHLLDHLGDSHVLPAAMSAASRYPRRALRLVARRAADADAAQRRRLSAVLASDPVLLEAALPTMDERVQEQIAALVESRVSAPIASDERLPSLLVNPPWKRKRRKSKPKIVEGLVPPPVSRVELDGIGRPHFERRRLNEQPHYDAMDERFGEAGFDYEGFFLFASIEVARKRLGQWHRKIYSMRTAELTEILHRFGADAIDPVLCNVEPAASTMSTILPVVDVKAARMAADWCSRGKDARSTARRWLERHPDDAALLLVPDALGTSAAARSAAEKALRYVAATFGTEVVDAAAERYGSESAAAIKELTGGDPLDPVGRRIPRTAAQFRPEFLPQVLLKGCDSALPDSAVEHLVTVLAIAAPEYYPYAGIEVVAELCDRESLTHFSWALFEHWIEIGSPVTHRWAFTQLAHFADDDTVAELAALITSWRGRSLGMRASAGLEVLGAIGSEAALRAIDSISVKSEFEALARDAAVQIQSVAENLGLSDEQLRDRLIPDFGIGEESALTIDYGARTFKVGFDQHLRPFITDEAGNPRKHLPRPGVRDDEELARAGRRRFTRLKKELRTVSTKQIKRLEQAMIDGRTWAKEEFRQCFVDHPLMWHVVCRLVWFAEADGGRSAFRLAEDGTFTTLEEDELEVPEDALIRLAHPIQLGDDAVAWSRILDDYEILQPFPQVERPVMSLTEEELRTGRLARFEGRTASTGALMGLTRKGWDCDLSWRGGHGSQMLYWWPDFGRVTIEIRPAIGDAGEHELHTLAEPRLHRPKSDADGEGVDTGPSAIDPVRASEFLADLAKATRLDPAPVAPGP